MALLGNAFEQLVHCGAFCPRFCVRISVREPYTYQLDVETWNAHFNHFVDKSFYPHGIIRLDDIEEKEKPTVGLPAHASNDA